MVLEQARELVDQLEQMSEEPNIISVTIDRDEFASVHLRDSAAMNIVAEAFPGSYLYLVVRDDSEYPYGIQRRVGDVVYFYLSREDFS